MTVDWHAITPWASLAGGGLIGVVAGPLARLNGPISGISGVLAGLLVPVMGDLAWRLAFVAGLAGVAGVHRLVSRLPTVLIDGS